MNSLFSKRVHHREMFHDIESFSNTDTNLIFSVRGVPGVNKFVENRLYKQDIRTASELLSIYQQYSRLYGNNKKCAYAVGRYMDRIGIMEPRSSVIVDALRAREQVISGNLMIKPHFIIDKYF